uniref:Uncharacterized protein n=1 Tax=Anguilla anguilla TaxID=7936 RepID=A0A0E9RZE7_ANGAN
MQLLMGEITAERNSSSLFSCLIKG